MNEGTSNIEQLAAEALANDWEITVSPAYSKQEIVKKLALKMASVMEQGPEPFFRLMYRLDIPEPKLVDAMHNKNAVTEIAELVYNRQLQKMRSRQFYKGRHARGDELSW